MKALILPAILLAGFYLASAVREYPNIWDHINLDETFRNERLFNRYANCLLGQGKCSIEGAHLKKFLPDALKTKCGKCTEKQKEGTAKIIKYMTDNKPHLWKGLVALYDPIGEYMESYANELKKTDEKA